MVEYMIRIMKIDMCDFSNRELLMLAVKRQLYIFPVAVVVLAFLTFLFGGRCAAWQWWCGLAISVASGFWRLPLRSGLAATVCFLLWLCLVWIMCGTMIAPCGFDEGAYHFPAVEMLAEGWNPIWASTPESALAFWGGHGDFKVGHVVFMAKPVWVFSAVARYFTCDVLHPLLPILWFVFPALAVKICESMRGMRLIWQIGAIAIIYCLGVHSGYVVDEVVALSAVGLLIAFEEALDARRIDKLSLVVFSFWMMSSKAPGLAHGIVFWLVFLIVVLIKHTVKLSSAMQPGLIAAAIMMLVCSTPYITSICHYGHPLYPEYTFDAQKHPTASLTADFVERRNEDAAAMGYLGNWANAYFSPALTRAWYSWRLNKPDFMPNSFTWGAYPMKGNGTSPIRTPARMLFWCSIVGMCLSGRKSFRVIAVMILLGISVAPAPMVGYVRYVPWFMAPVLFMYIHLSAQHRHRARFMAVAFAGALFLMPPEHFLKRIAYPFVLMEQRQAFYSLLDQASPMPTIRPQFAKFEAIVNVARERYLVIGQAEMLEHSRTLYYAYEKDKLRLPGKLFMFDDPETQRLFALKRPKNKKEEAKYMLHCMFVAFPNSVVARMKSVFSN